MARVNRMQSETSNPAKKFFQWKSDHQKFCYYDKAEQQNVFVDLPFKFLALSRYKTIKGWNQKKEGAIISNEVKSLKDELIVNFYKKGQDKTQIARGPWNDIKDAVETWDGKYTESVYAMLPDGELVNIQLSGASLSTWFEFQKNLTDMFFDNWVVVNGFKEGKQGAVTYTFPVFEWGGMLDKNAQGLAEVADGLIDKYEAGYFGKTQEEDQGRENSEVDKYEKRQRVDAENEMHKSLTPVPPLDDDAYDADYDERMKNYDPDDLPF